MSAAQQAPQFVDSADGVRIAVYEEGNPDGPTVVLVHGFPDSHVLWDGVVPLLAERFRIIRYDNRGVGLSSAPKPVSAYAMARFADDFAAVIRRAEPRPAGARAGPRLGVGRHVGVPDPPGRQRPGRVVHVGVRTEPGHPGRLHLQRSAPALAPATVCAVGQPDAALHLYGAASRYRCWRRWCLRLTLSIPTVRRNAVDNIPVDQIHHSAELGQGCRPFGEDLPRQLLSGSQFSARAGASSTCPCS